MPFIPEVLRCSPALTSQSIKTQPSAAQVLDSLENQNLMANLCSHERPTGFGRIFLSTGGTEGDVSKFKIHFKSGIEESFLPSKELYIAG